MYREYTSATYILIQSSFLLLQPPIKFLPEFKNPCWRENFTTHIYDMYANNGFAKYSHTYEKAFSKFIRRWAKQTPRRSHRLRCLPYFFLAGQPKCGSTDLYNKIISHPDIVIPPVKESHWWGKNRYGKCWQNVCVCGHLYKIFFKVSQDLVIVLPCLISILGYLAMQRWHLDFCKRNVGFLFLNKTEREM